MYERYPQVLLWETQKLEYNPTEVRHLIGRLGRFYCAIYAIGSLARKTNRHGFDVISRAGKKVSVKTTSQISGFYVIKQNILKEVDEIILLQYGASKDDLGLIYYGTKDEIVEIGRIYRKNYKVDINKAKRMYNQKLIATYKKRNLTYVFTVVSSAF